MDDDWDFDILINCTTIPAVAQIHLRKWKRVAVLIVAAFCGGASVGRLINLMVMTDTSIIVSTLVATAVVYGCFSVAVMLTLRRDYIYMGSLIFSNILIRNWLHYASIVFGGYTAFWEIKAHQDWARQAGGGPGYFPADSSDLSVPTLNFLAIMYIVGLAAYSQVMIDQAEFGNANYVDNVFDITVYFAGLLILIVLTLMKQASAFERERRRN
ncbi:unnamed protein product [Ilex paraguariensis]|uniref:Uncharacterized protein n=1 Tax=Ilex paraguariensis TaxID=185542 RepID=A0ABC8S314_9AQUA